MIGGSSSPAWSSSASSPRSSCATSCRSVMALALGGLYHGYRQLGNRKINQALVQGVETARAILETTPQGQAVGAAFVKWLIRAAMGITGPRTTDDRPIPHVDNRPLADIFAVNFDHYWYILVHFRTFSHILEQF